MASLKAINAALFFFLIICLQNSIEYKNFFAEIKGKKSFIFSISVIFKFQTNWQGKLKVAQNKKNMHSRYTIKMKLINYK